MGSEVAELRKRLEEEYIAGRRALYAPASGWSKHAFIEARMRNMERYHQRLCELVGPEQALKLVFEVFERGESLLPERAASQGQGAAPAEALAVTEGATSRAEASLLEQEQAGVGLAVSDGSGGDTEPLPALQASGASGEDEPEAPKTLWLLASSAGATSDLLYLFYAADEEEAQALAQEWLRLLAPWVKLRALQPLPTGLTLAHGHYRGLIHVRPDGSLVEGQYFLAAESMASQESKPVGQEAASS
ncbi:hypothetical protein [Thermogemmatispora carboxidivorans]|uniref:hypothetical protein n=1 Tax=Thermogemmatispora carboxidivorans TaxID=1382306 RepID=UPI00069A7FA2|nr:hypothetical protein [Thermogemmatispora carboxidivorans]